MRTDLYYEMYDLEEHYWWHVAKRIMVKKMLKNIFKDTQKRTFVDMGCGTGMLLKEISELSRWKEIIGLDGSTTALKLSKQRGAKKLNKLTLKQSYHYPINLLTLLLAWT